MFEDKTLVCKDCGKEFVWTAGEQELSRMASVAATTAVSARVRAPAGKGKADAGTCPL